MEGKIKIGPVGMQDPGSKSLVRWDEGGHNGIVSQIFLSHCPDGISCIQFQSVLDDKFVLSSKYGQHTGDMFDVITLNFPHENIIGISGTYNPNEGGNPHIKSLKFTTNNNEYGPFGSSSSNVWKKFEFKLGNFCQFGGFHGTYNIWGLQYIGVYLQPATVKPKSNPEEIESKIVLA